MTGREKKIVHVRPGEKLPRVGLFGGTFNPIHRGHVRVIEDVKSGWNLDKVYVIPSAIPPHKKTVNIVAARDRLHMVRLSFKDLEGFFVSDVELKRKGPSFTIDTVKHFLSDMQVRGDFFIIIGTDAFFEIHTWKSFQNILELVPLLVMVRPGDNMETELSKEKKGGDYLTCKISPDYRWSREEKSFNHPVKKKVCFYDVTPHNISSTEIRKRVKEGRPVSMCLSNDVSDYIKKKGLYL